MNRCNLSEARLQQWLDGELVDAEVSEHVEHCLTCESRIESLESAQFRLQAMIDEGVGEVEPLIAVQRIHARIAETKRNSLSNRIQTWWQDVWAFHRRAVAGIAIAAGMGAATAPAVLLLTTPPAQEPAYMASVVVESVSYDGDARAMVFHPEGTDTTIIWVESDAEAWEEN